MRDVLYLVMPAYNEEENIRGVVESWYKVVADKDPDSRIVIADNGSTDSTHEILLDMQKDYPLVEILENTRKEHGPKLIGLYNYAIKNGASYIFQTDSDGQTNPDEFAAFWNERENYDAVIGNRTVRGDGKSRAFVERVVCMLLRFIFGVKVPDANAPFRLMKASLVAKYIDKFPEDYNIPNIIFTAYFAYFKERICFKEISFKSRQGGVNSINIKKIVKIGIKAIKDFMYFRKDMRK